MTQQWNLKSGTLQVRSVTTVWHPCITEEHRLPLWSMTSQTRHVHPPLSSLCNFPNIVLTLSSTDETCDVVSLQDAVRLLVQEVRAQLQLLFYLQESFARAKNWVKELQRQASPNIVIALSGNKADLANKRAVDFQVRPNKLCLHNHSYFVHFLGTLISYF